MAGNYPYDLSINDIKPNTNGRLFATDKTVNVYDTWRPDQYSINDIKIGIDTFNYGGAMGIAFVYPLEFKFYYDPGFDADFIIKDTETNKDLTDKKLILTNGQSTATVDIIPDYKAIIGSLDEMDLEWVRWYKGTNTSGQLIKEFTEPTITDPQASKIAQPNLPFGIYNYTLEAKVKGIDEPKTVTHNLEIIDPINDNRPLALVAIKQGDDFTTDDDANFYMNKDSAENKTPNQITFKNLCEPKELQVDRYEWKLDDRGNEAFDVLEGIPSSEELYANIIAKNYYIGDKTYYKAVTGTKEYKVTVKKTYNLSWEKSESYEGSKAVYCEGVCKNKKATDKDTSCDGHSKPTTKYHVVCIS